MRRYTKKTKYELKLPDINLSKFFLLLILILLGYFLTNSLIKYMILKKQYKTLQDQLVKLERENKNLTTEIYLLKSDTSTIEYYIRKELKYKKIGEKVLILK
ncbi:MAG: septum formation initiator family protein [Endomicrobia bacterium]|nr:septum formation initiator family protein [Endomicrobiia bacterium]